MPNTPAPKVTPADSSPTKTVPDTTPTPTPTPTPAASTPAPTPAPAPAPTPAPTPAKAAKDTKAAKPAPVKKAAKPARAKKAAKRAPARTRTTPAATTKATTIPSGKNAGAVYLDSCEKAVLSFADTVEKVAGSTNNSWVAGIVSAQADLTREFTKAYANAARELVS